MKIVKYLNFVMDKIQLVIYIDFEKIFEETST